MRKKWSTIPALISRREIYRSPDPRRKSDDANINNTYDKETQTSSIEAISTPPSKLLATSSPPVDTPVIEC